MLGKMILRLLTLHKRVDIQSDRLVNFSFLIFIHDLRHAILDCIRSALTTRSVAFDLPPPSPAFILHKINLNKNEYHSLAATAVVYVRRDDEHKCAN